MPRMTLLAVRPSSIMENGTETNLAAVEYDLDQIQWDREIPLTEAVDILERTMYPFKKVTNSAFMQHYH